MLLFSQVEGTTQLFWGNKRFIGEAFKLVTLLFCFYVPHRYGQEMELEAGSGSMKNLAWRDLTLVFFRENILHTLTFSERRCCRALHRLLSSHGQPSATSWENSWFWLVFITFGCTHTGTEGWRFQGEKETSQKAVGTQTRSLLFTEEQRC